MNTKYKSIGGKRKMKSGASGIYAIKNKMNNKRYIGSSTNINRRLKAHLSDLRKGRGPKKIQKDFDKYGENSFEFSVVETTLKPRKELLKLEDYYIKKFNALSEGYNTRTAIPNGRNDVSTVLNDNIFELVKNDSKNKNVTISAWVRRAVIEKLEREDLT